MATATARTTASSGPARTGRKRERTQAAVEAPRVHGQGQPLATTEGHHQHDEETPRHGRQASGRRAWRQAAEPTRRAGGLPVGRRPGRQAHGGDAAVGQAIGQVELLHERIGQAGQVGRREDQEAREPDDEDPEGQGDARLQARRA